MSTLTIPLALYAHEVAALRMGTLSRLLRKECLSDQHDQQPFVYTFGQQRFTCLKWRCHKPEVVSEIEGEMDREPLTLEQIQGAGLPDEEAFWGWYRDNNILSDVWLAKLELVGEG